MNVAITGGRHYTPTHDDLVWFYAALLGITPPLTYLVGDCRKGVDAYLAKELDNKKFVVHRFFAQWYKHGKAAGPIRNQAMIDQADMLVAFPGGRGTHDTITRAQAKGIPVILHHQHGGCCAVIKEA